MRPPVRRKGPARREDTYASGRLAEVVSRLSAAGRMDQWTRGRLLGRLAGGIGMSARKAGLAGVISGQWLADVLLHAASRLPIRDLATLHAHHHELRGEALADSLVEAATRATTGIGAAGGALAGVQHTAPPALVYAPAQLAAETLAVAAIEVKLVAELHEVYEVEVRGSPNERAVGFVTAWARRRGFDPADPASLPCALGPAARDELRRRLLLRMGRNATTLGPLFTGAMAGGALNQQATRKLAQRVRGDLRPRAGSGGGGDYGS